MEKHVCYDKLQKKKQREIDQRKRGSWLGVNPVTRRPDNSRAYQRKKAQDWKKDSGLALFLCENPSHFAGRGFRALRLLCDEALGLQCGYQLLVRFAG